MFFFQIMQCHIKKYVIGSKLYDMKESYNVNINIIYYLFHPRNVCSQQKSQNFKNQFQIPNFILMGIKQSNYPSHEYTYSNSQA